MAVANQTPANVANDYAVIQFIVQQLMGTMATATLVKVVACTNDGGLSPVGTVDVQPLVNLMTGDRVAIQHNVLYKLPYNRIQGGASAFIIDPEPGDVGIAVFASRDISAAKAVKGIANPGSQRQFSMADGLYIGGFLNGTPTQYVQANSEGITVKSPSAITLEAPTINIKGAVVQTDGDVSMSGDLMAAGTITGATDVVAATISGKDHTHPAGSPNTGPPNP